MTQPAASDIRVGAVLRDTYEITSLLGKGGMGAVFLARHRRLPGKQVAVKVLHNSASLNPELYARFRREAEIASQLGHPNIVEVLDFDTLQDGTPFLVMEYLRGESLEQRLSRGPLQVDAALSITRQVCSALQAAHRAGVVHRDLKPANVFLVPTDSGGVVGERVKLLDFGISKMLDSQTLQTQDAVLIGTPQYMAPEQALGKNSEVDARTDIFALGCIVYELLSGRPPFAGDGGSIVQVVFRIVHGQPEPLASLCPDVPSRVLGAVERALAKSPQDRYPDVGSFISELTGIPLQSLAGAPVPSFSSSRAASVPSGAVEDGGFAATHMPSSTARFGASAAGAAEDGGFAATHMPASTARFGAPAAGAGDDAGFAATHMPSSTARFPAPSAATDEAGFAATLVPASTAISPVQPAPAPAAVAGDAGFAATHVPSSTARIPAPVAQPPSASPVSATATPVAASVPGAVQVPVPQAVPARSGPRPGMFAGAGVLVLALVGMGWWFGTRSAPAPVSEMPGPVSGAPGPVAGPPPAQIPAHATEAPAEPKATAVPEPTAAASTSTTSSSSTSTSVEPKATVSNPPEHQPKSEALPENVREALQAAERALAEGKADDAIRLARGSHKDKVTAASFAVTTRAYCLKGNHSSANGQWREGIKRNMSAKDRRQVTKFCEKHDIELKF